MADKLLNEVLTYIQGENGVTASDLSVKFHITRNHASNYLSILKSREKVFSERIPGRTTAHKWYARKDIEALWRVTG